MNYCLLHESLKGCVELYFAFDQSIGVLEGCLHADLLVVVVALCRHSDVIQGSLAVQGELHGVGHAVVGVLAVVVDLPQGSLVEGPGRGFVDLQVVAVGDLLRKLMSMFRG